MLQNVTAVPASTGVEPYKQGSFDAYITYCALGGIMTEDDSETRRMSIDEFCATYNVSRMTLNRWKKQTPNWSEKVQNRRNEIMPLARVTAVWNSMYLIARQSQDKRAAVEAGKLFLGHNGLQLPVQRQQVKIESNVGDLLRSARDEGVIEGEVADATADYAEANGADAGALPLPS